MANGIGAGAAFGADAISQALRQQILDRLNAQSQAQQYGLEQRRMALQEQDAAMKAQEFQQSLEERKAAQADRSQAENVANATKIAPTLAIDQNVAPQAASILQRGGLGAQLYAPPTMGETASGAAFDPTTANPSINLGTAAQQKDEADTRQLNALANAPDTSPAMRGFLRVRAALPKGENIPYQLITEPNGPPTTTTDANYLLNGKPIVAQRNRQGRLIYQGNDVTDTVKPYVPPKEGNWSVQSVQGPDGKPIIIRVNASTGETQPFKGGAEYSLRKPVAGATETRLASAEAVNQSGNDIIQQLSDPTFANNLGPVLGRYNSLRDFIGNPPPEYSQLAGEIESYALASMGVHGMRSAQGASQIAELMSKKHTPASIIATIKGLNNFSSHFMQNEGRSQTQSTTKPSTNQAQAPVEHWVQGPNGTLVKQ